MADDLAVILGNNVKALRDQEGLTLDQVAMQSRAYGAKWTAQRIKGMESGRAAVTMPTLLTLAWTFSALVDYEVRVADLLRTSGEVEINDGFTVAGAVIRRAIDGTEAEHQPRDLPDRAAHRGHTRRYRLTPAEETGSGDALLDAGLEAYTGLADQRTAQRLGIPVSRLAGMSYRKWGRVFSKEVESRAGASASPQRKGHVTRALEAELRKELHGND